MPTITLKGPLFDQPASVVRRGVQNAIQELVETGEQRLNQMLRSRPAGVYLSVTEAQKGKASKGHYRRSIHARVSNLQGKIDDGNVVYGPWLEGTSSRNETTRFKGYASFRRTAQHLEKNKGRVLQKHVNRIIRELNG